MVPVIVCDWLGQSTFFSSAYDSPMKRKTPVAALALLPRRGLDARAAVA